MMKNGLYTILLMLPFLGLSQEDPAKQNIIEQRIEVIAELFEDEDVDFTTLFDDLSYYFDHPLNINSASKEELNALYLFTERQVLEILVYREKYGQFLTIYELQYVKTLDKTTVDMVLPFVMVNAKQENDNVKLIDRLRNGRNQLFIRYQRVLEEMEGYTAIDDSTLSASPNKRYLGSPDRVYMRYRYQFRNSLSIGFTADKDAGEEFFKGTQKQGFDFYSMHLYAKNLGRIKKIALGDYQVQFGQGLALWSGLAFGKSAIVRNMKRNATGIRPYSSVDENLFMRGAGATLGFGKFEFTAFGSYKNIDGNVLENTDTTDMNDIFAFSSFQQSGYHRTPSELADRKQISEFHSGSHVSYKTERMHLGVSGVYTSYGSELERTVYPYNQYNFRGKENMNAAFDYNLFAGGFNFFGESAISQSGGTAHLAGVMTELDSKVRFIGMLRSYDRDYQALLANAFGEGSNSSNEKGTLLAIEAKLNKNMDFQGYADFYRWRWLGNQRNAPSNGQDYLGQLNVKLNRSASFYVRYKWETKPYNQDLEVVGIEFPKPETKQQLRFHFDKRFGEFKVRSRMEFTRFDPNDGEQENGYMLYQDVQWKPYEHPITISARYALFQTDSYDTRIYAFENDVLYAFSIPAYYYRGSRTYVTIKYSPSRKIDLWLRWGQFFYNDRNVISSGLNEIQGNQKTEVKAQIRLKF